MALDSVAERGELKARENVHGHAGVDGVVKEEADSFIIIENQYLTIIVINGGMVG